MTHPERRTPRRLRTLLVVLVASWLVMTGVSLGFNALTTAPRTLRALEGDDVQVGDTRVHYQQWGTQGRPIVLIHGFFESAVVWAPAAHALARDHRVYAMDLAGYGYSDYNGRYTLDDEVALVAGFTKALGLRRPILVGHSLGAAVVGGVALAHPDDIDGVIFADGDALSFGNGDQRPRGADWLVDSPYLTSGYRLVTATPLSRTVLRRSCGSVCRGLTPELAAAWMRPSRQAAAEDALKTIARGGVLHLEPAQIRAITVPRAIIWGAEDARSGGSLSEAQGNLHDPPTVILPGAGHLSMIADPDAFAAAVGTLVARMPAS